MSDSQTDTELFQFCMGLWKRIRTRLSAVKLPSQEWEDIRSEAIIRVFQKRHRLDPNRPFGPWAFTVMWRCTQNALRRFLPRKDLKAHKWRTNFQMARSIETRVVQLDDWGNECVRIEPDIVDMHPTPIITSEVDDFAATLKRSERRLLRIATESETIQQVANKLGWKYGRAQRGLLDLQRAYQRYQLAA